MSDPIRVLSDKTRLERREKLESFMAAHGLDAMFVFGDGAVAWIAGEFMRYPDAYVLLARNAEPVLFVSNPERAYVLYGLRKNRKDFWIKDFRINSPEELKRGFAELSLSAARVGVVERSLSLGMYRALKTISPAIEFMDISEEYQALRRIKNDEDIKLVKQSVYTVDRAVEALAGSARSGMYENELKAVMERSMYESGAHDTLNLCAVDAADISFVSMPGDHCSALIKPGDIVCCEVTACFHQTWTQQIVHLSMGVPSVAFQTIHDACKAGHDAAASMIRPGINAKDMMNAGCAEIEARGFLSGRQFMSGPPGHLVGFERDEGTFSYDRDFLLEAGMVLDLHLSAAIQDWKPGMSGVFGPGSTFLVTENGAVSLNRWPNDIIICP